MRVDLDVPELDIAKLRKDRLSKIELTRSQENSMTAKFIALEWRRTLSHVLFQLRCRWRILKQRLRSGMLAKVSIDLVFLKIK